MMNIKPTKDYTHFLWKRCFHPDAYQGALPELITTNGEIVRRVVSQRQLIYIQIFRNPETGNEILRRVNESASAGSALLGYSIFSKSEAISILRAGTCESPGWVAFPYQSLKNATIPTLPLSVADLPKLRLVCGARLIWKSGARFIECALEQRGDTFSAGEFAFNFIDHVEHISLLGQKGRAPDYEDVRIVPRRANVELNHVSDSRIEIRFPIDELIMEKYRDGKDLTLWFKVIFDSKFLCLPEDWRTFYMSVPVEGFNTNAS